MSGNHAGGLKAKAKNLARDPEHYIKMGRAGGKKGRTGGFYDRRPWYKKLLHPKNPKAVQAGKIGGAKSSRGPSKKTLEKRAREHYSDMWPEYYYEDMPPTNYRVKR